MQLLDGKFVSEKFKERIAIEAAEVLIKTGRKPHLDDIDLINFI